MATYYAKLKDLAADTSISGSTLRRWAFSVGAIVLQGRLYTLNHPERDDPGLSHLPRSSAFDLFLGTVDPLTKCRKRSRSANS
jgi:hypothetical protein